MESGVGKFLILAGVCFIIIGALLSVHGHVHWFGRLPGDILIKKQNFSLYFPITTCLLISLMLTFVLYLLKK